MKRLINVKLLSKKNNMNITNVISTKIVGICKNLGIVIYKKPKDITEKDYEIIDYVKPYTMTSEFTILSLIDAVKYVVANQIEGDFVECGVWKGGSIMTIIKTLQQLQINDRHIHLYDTFEGMSIPTKEDVNLHDETASSDYENHKKVTYADLTQVQKTILETGYDREKIHFIKGKVEDTIPKNMPNNISLLRLDTDWYESTKHELENLFTLVSKEGVIIIDDYMAWSGAKKAVDEYFKENKVAMFFHRIYPQGQRIGIKI